MNVAGCYISTVGDVACHGMPRLVLRRVEVCALFQPTFMHDCAIPVVHYFVHCLVWLELPITVRMERTIRPRVARLASISQNEILVHPGMAGATFLSLIRVCVAHELHLGVGGVLKLH
jgi:hypothetical protein